MTNFNYKKHSLQHLDEWIHDALNCDEIAPKEIYDTILNVVNDSIEYHRNNLDRGVELLSLLKGHRPIEIEEATDKDWEDFWESTEEVSKEQWAHPESSLYKHLQYTEEELNAMCDAAEDKEKCREYNLREAEYYTKRAELDAKQDKVIKWQLPVQVDELSGDCFVEFPDDLLKSANLKEGDQVKWVDKGDGSYLLIKT